MNELWMENDPFSPPAAVPCSMCVSVFFDSCIKMAQFTFRNVKELKIVFPPLNWMDRGTCICCAFIYFTFGLNQLQTLSVLLTNTICDDNLKNKHCICTFKWNTSLDCVSNGDFVWCITFDDFQFAIFYLMFKSFD